MLDTYFEHLYEGHAQVQIRQIAADKTGTVHDADGNNCPHILPASHLDRLAAIKQPCGPRKDLSSKGSKDHVP